MKSTSYVHKREQITNCERLTPTVYYKKISYCWEVMQCLVDEKNWEKMALNGGSKDSFIWMSAVSPSINVCEREASNLWGKIRSRSDSYIWEFLFHAYGVTQTRISLFCHNTFTSQTDATVTKPPCICTKGSKNSTVNFFVSHTVSKIMAKFINAVNSIDILCVFGSYANTGTFWRLS